MVRNSKSLKKYREGNVTSAFGTDFMMQGFTCVPNILLKNYKHLGITDSEMLLLIQLLRSWSEERDIFPSPETLSKSVQSDISEIERNLASLLEKDILAITKYFDENKNMTVTGYDFEPLFYYLSEEWACAKKREYDETQRLLEEQEHHISACNRIQPDQELAQLYKTFENEFARPLSPMEIEQICSWSKEIDHQLIREALRRAVLMGKHNFKYIDSIILEWKKNNLKTINAVNDYERNFQRRRSTKNFRASEPVVEQTAAGEAKKKALIKSLYMS